MTSGSKRSGRFPADATTSMSSSNRDIRASERRFYQKICDIYTTSVDYDADTDAAQKFFATVQNKLHWAIHGKTAAQLISERADATKPNMGLTTWKNAPAGPIRKADIEVAKNYLAVEEIRALNLLLDQYLSFAEFQAQQRKPMTMAAWATKLDAFLKLNDRDILADAGRISHKVAIGLAGRDSKSTTENSNGSPQRPKQISTRPWITSRSSTRRHYETPSCAAIAPRGPGWQDGGVPGQISGWCVPPPTQPVERRPRAIIRAERRPGPDLPA